MLIYNISISKLSVAIIHISVDGLDRWLDKQISSY